MVFAYGLGAGVFLAVGFVIQQHAASSAPEQEHLRLRILLDLVRRPLWLSGIAAMVVGQVLGAVALREGQLTLVEPLMATNVLFALPLAAAWWRRRLGRREWVGAVLVVAGLAVFVVAAHPGRLRHTLVPLTGWVAAGAAILAVGLAATVVGKRLPPVREATLLGLGAGALFGLQDALTQRTMELHLSLSALTAWPPYALLAVAIGGLVLAQSAYQAAPLTASLPAISTVEPITGICLGAGLFSEGLRLGPAPMAVEVAGVVTMMAGLLLLTRSRVVAAGAPVA